MIYRESIWLREEESSTSTKRTPGARIFTITSSWNSSSSCQEELTLSLQRLSFVDLFPQELTDHLSPSPSLSSTLEKTEIELLLSFQPSPMTKECLKFPSSLSPHLDSLKPLEQESPKLVENAWLLMSSSCNPQLVSGINTFWSLYLRFKHAPS